MQLGAVRQGALSNYGGCGPPVIAREMNRGDQKARRGIRRPPSDLGFLPTINSLSPLPGGDFQGRIHISLTCGDFSKPQVSIPNIKLLLDGNDVTSQLRIDVTMNPDLRVGTILQSIDVVYEPPSPLSQGVHHVTVTAPTTAYLSGVGKQSVQTYEFIVASAGVNSPPMPGDGW